MFAKVELCSTVTDWIVKADPLIALLHLTDENK